MENFFQEKVDRNITNNHKRIYVVIAKGNAVNLVIKRQENVLNKDSVKVRSYLLCCGKLG